VDVLGMKSFESDGMTPMTGLLVALSVKDAAEEGALATKLLAALENPHSKLHLAMPKCPEARQQAKGCEWDGKNVFVNYGYNPEIKGGGKGGDEKPLEAGMKAGGGAAMVGESGHTMVGSEPMKVSLGAAYRRPVVIAGIPALNEACAKASAAQVAAQGSECDEFVVRVDVEGGMKDGKFDSFTMFLEEPLCRDGKHAKVQVPWIVVEAGSYHDDEGDIIAAGAVDVTGSGWAPVAFPLDGFEDDDVTLLTQVMTARDRGKAPTKDPSSPRGWYLKTKQRNLRDHGFEVAIEVDTDRQPNGGSRWDASNEAAGADATLHETVGYLATMKGAFLSSLSSLMPSHLPIQPQPNSHAEGRSAAEVRTARRPREAQWRALRGGPRGRRPRGPTVAAARRCQDHHHGVGPLRGASPPSSLPPLLRRRSVPRPPAPSTPPAPRFPRAL
jgi:hypothetical protein